MAKPEAWNSIQVSYFDVRGLIIQAVLCCFPWCVSRELDQKGSSLDLNQCSYEMSEFQMAVLYYWPSWSLHLMKEVLIRGRKEDTRTKRKPWRQGGRGIRAFTLCFGLTSCSVIGGEIQRLRYTARLLQQISTNVTGDFRVSSKAHWGC